MITAFLIGRWNAMDDRTSYCIDATIHTTQFKYTLFAGNERSCTPSPNQYAIRPTPKNTHNYTQHSTLHTPIGNSRGNDDAKIGVICDDDAFSFPCYTYCLDWCLFWRINARYYEDCDQDAERRCQRWLRECQGYGNWTVDLRFALSCLGPPTTFSSPAWCLLRELWSSTSSTSSSKSVWESMHCSIVELWL